MQGENSQRIDLDTSIFTNIKFYLLIFVVRHNPAILSALLLFLMELTMKLLPALALFFALGLSLTTLDADAARRLGAGKSSGMQRQSTTDKAPNTPAAQPSAAPAAAPAAGAATAPKRSWMGPLAGIAAGLGIAALASHFGFGEQLASMMTMGLLALAVVAVIGFVLRKRAAARGLYAGSGAGSGGLTLKRNDVALPSAGGPDSSGGSGGSGNLGNLRTSADVAATPRNIPADFDTVGFEHNARMQFIRLQAANDASDLDDIGLFTTPEMLAEAKKSIAERAGAEQKTEVLQVGAQVLSVVEDGAHYVTSVRFTGMLRDAMDLQDEPFDETWHLVKARSGAGGWLLSGIQQNQH